MTTVEQPLVRTSAPSAPSQPHPAPARESVDDSRPRGAALAMPVLATGLVASLALYATLGVLLVMLLARAVAGV